MTETGKEGQSRVSVLEKAKILERLKKKSTDEKPVFVILRNAQILPWVGTNGEVPERGTLIGVTYGKVGNRKIPQGVTVDFTRYEFNWELPYANFPLSAVEIAEESVTVDCSLAQDVGIGVPFNKFGARSQN